MSFYLIEKLSQLYELIKMYKKLNKIYEIIIITNTFCMLISQFFLLHLKLNFKFKIKYF